MGAAGRGVVSRLPDSLSNPRSGEWWLVKMYCSRTECLCVHVCVQVGVQVKWVHFPSVRVLFRTAKHPHADYSLGFGYGWCERISTHIICQVMGGLGPEVSYSFFVFSWMLLNACMSHYLPALVDLWAVRVCSSRGGQAITQVRLGFLMLGFIPSLNFRLDMTFRVAVWDDKAPLMC